MSQKRGTKAQWEASTLVLLAGEIAVESDTGKLKVGNGVDTYGQLPYSSGEFAEKVGDGNGNFTYAQLVSSFAEKIAASALGAWAKASDKPNYAYGDGYLSGFGSAAQKTAGSAAGNIPVLDANGLLPTSTIPPLAISETYVVSSESAMLALTAQRGDVAIRSDVNKTFILSVDGGAATLANWKQILTPAAPVQSVNGKTGTVTLTYSDVGSDASGAAAAVQTNLNTHTGNTTVHITATERSTWNGKAAVGSVVGSALASSASAGTSSTAARADHVHPFPTPANIGAVPTSRTVAGKALSANITIALADLSDGANALHNGDTYVWDGGALA